MTANLAHKQTTSLKINFSWTLVGNFVYMASQGGVLILLAKLGSPSMVGRFTLALAICTPIFLLTNLKLRDIQAADAQEKFRFPIYLTVRLLTTTIAILVVTLIVFIFNYPKETSSIIIIMGIAKAFESFSDLLYGLQQKHEKMNRIAISMIGKGILTLLSVTIVMVLTGDLFSGISTLAAVWLITLLVYDIPSGMHLLLTQKRLVPSILLPINTDKNNNSTDKIAGKSMRLIWLALPLGIAATLTSLTVNLPNYLIQYYLNEDMLGIFAALSYPIIAGGVIVGALAQVALPRLSKYHVNVDYLNFNKLLRKLLSISVLLGIIGIAIAITGSKFILTFLYNETYAAYSTVFIWLMVAASISYASWFLSSALTAVGIFRKQLVLRIMSILVVTTASLLLIPRFGLLGAAWAICLKSIITLLLFAIVYTSWNYVNITHNN